MHTARCPNCLGEHGRAADRALNDSGGVRVDYECSSCDHSWVVVF